MPDRITGSFHRDGNPQAASPSGPVRWAVTAAGGGTHGRDRRVGNGHTFLPSPESLTGAMTGPGGPRTDPRHDAGDQPDLHSVGLSGAIARPQGGSVDRSHRRLAVVGCLAGRILKLPASSGALQQRPSGSNASCPGSTRPFRIPNGTRSTNDSKARSGPPACKNDRLSLPCAYLIASARTMRNRRGQRSTSRDDQSASTDLPLVRSAQRIDSSALLVRSA